MDILVKKHRMVTMLFRLDEFPWLQGYFLALVVSCLLIKPFIKLN